MHEVFVSTHSNMHSLRITLKLSLSHSEELDLTICMRYVFKRFIAVYIILALMDQLVYTFAAWWPWLLVLHSDRVDVILILYTVEANW